MVLHYSINFTTLTKGEIYTKLCVETEIGTYTSYLRGKRCKTEELFFNEVSASFQFPYYFGENWAAMDECLCDLEWLCTSRIFVVIDDFTCMFSEEGNRADILRKRVLKYFAIMIEYWADKSVTVEIWANN